MNRRTKALAFVCALSVGILVACNAVRPVHLQHPDTGELVECAGSHGATFTHPSRVLEQRGCIDDFMAQGYQRVAEP